jgi:hypothetical protein
MKILVLPALALVLSTTGCGDSGSSTRLSAATAGTGGDESDTSSTADTRSTQGTSAGSGGSASESGGSDSTTSGPSSGSQTSSAGSTGSTSGAETSTTGPMGSSIEIQGNFGAESLDYGCDFTDPTFSDVDCEAGRWFATCRPDPIGVGSIESFQVWFVLSAEDGMAGTNDYLDSQFGISMGDATAAISPLTPNSLNAQVNAITVDADANAMEPVSGTFEASWTDEGGQFGSISGTFEFACD